MKTNYTFGKILAFVLAVIMAASCFTVAGLAASDGKLAVSSVSDAKPGDTVSIRVSVSGNPGVAGLSLKLYYDNTKLIPSSVSGGSAIGGLSVTSNIYSPGFNYTKADYVTAIIYQPADITKNGEFFVFTFTVSSKATAGDFAVTVVCDDASDQYFSTLSFSSAVGKVTVVSSESGSTDEDVKPAGKITKKPGAASIKYMAGYSDGTFKPNQAATRYEVVEAIYNLYDFDFPASTGINLKDVDTKHNAMVKLLVTSGVITGYTDNTFRGTKTITRAEFCAIVCRLLSIDTSKTKNAIKFNDTSKHWAKEYINACEDAGYVNGYTDGTFRPDKTISRAEVVTMINRIVGTRTGTSCPYSDVSTGDWFFGAVAGAAK